MKGSSQIKASNYISRSRVSLTLPLLLNSEKPSGRRNSIGGFSRSWVLTDFNPLMKNEENIYFPLVGASETLNTPDLTKYVLEVEEAQRGQKYGSKSPYKSVLRKDRQFLFCSRLYKD